MTAPLIIIIGLLGLIAVTLMGVLFVLYAGNQRREWHRERQG